MLVSGTREILVYLVGCDDHAVAFADCRHALELAARPGAPHGVVRVAQQEELDPVICDLALEVFEIHAVAAVHAVSLGLQVSKAKHTGESASDLGVR